MLLFRRGKGHGHGQGPNVEGWMMSYADMITVLLAMFIVLSALGKDQTGFALYRGTGSFVNALESFGMPGLFSTSSRAVQLEMPGPHYLGTESTDAADRKTPGHDGGKTGPRVIDAEEEQLQRFLHELDRQFRVEKLPRSAGQVSLDFYEPLQRAPPYLTPRQAEAVWQVIPLLRRGNYRLQVIVWATTPSPSAWLRAAQQAEELVDHLAGTVWLEGPARANLAALGQPWRYAGVRRPVFSLALVRGVRSRSGPGR